MLKLTCRNTRDAPLLMRQLLLVLLAATVLQRRSKWASKKLDTNGNKERSCRSLSVDRMDGTGAKSVSLLRTPVRCINKITNNQALITTTTDVLSTGAPSPGRANFGGGDQQPVSGTSESLPPRVCARPLRAHLTAHPEPLAVNCSVPGFCTCGLHTLLLPA